MFAHLLSRLFGCRVGVVDGIEKDHANAKAVAAGVAERDPEVRLH